MFTTFDVFLEYKKAEEYVKSKKCRMPKNWNDYLQNKISKSNREILETITNYFNTIWQDIDIYQYMIIGFTLYKNFTIKNFLNSKILNHYIKKDKSKKINDIDLNVETLKKSLKYLKNEINGLTLHDKFVYYANQKEMVINDYCHNKINLALVVWLIMDNYLILEDVDIDRIPYLKQRYDIIADKIKQKRKIFNKIKNKEIDNGHL